MRILNLVLLIVILNYVESSAWAAGKLYLKLKYRFFCGYALYDPEIYTEDEFIPPNPYDPVELRERITDDFAYRSITDTGNGIIRKSAHKLLRLDGHYHCVSCGEAVFDSRDKFLIGKRYNLFLNAIEFKIAEIEHFRKIRPYTAKCKNCGITLGTIQRKETIHSDRRYHINSDAVYFVMRDKQKKRGIMN